MCQSVAPVTATSGHSSPRDEADTRSRGATTRKARKRVAASLPQTLETITVFGPRRFDRVGLISQYTEQFSLPQNAVAPFAVQLQNGALDGSGRVLFATIRLNGVVLFGPQDIHLGVPSVNGPVTLTANNRLEVQFFGRQNSFLTITFTATSSTPIPRPVITDFNPKRGPAGTSVTLTGSNLSADTGTTTFTFAGGNNTRVPAVVNSSSPTQVLTTVPNDAVTGTIELTNANGLAVTNGVFTVESPQNFQLTVAPTIASAPQRGTGTYVVSITSEQSTFTQLARLSATGLPQGVRATFVPAQITAGATSTLSVSLSDVDLSPGSLSFSISATAFVEGQNLVRTASNITLNVLAAGQTTLSGRVLSTLNEPILGATASLDGRTATTDSAGTFLLGGVMAGVDRPVMIDGRTASAPNRTYPVITEPATVVAGQSNVVPFTFYLPPIDTQHEVAMIPGQDTAATNPRVPGLVMMVPSGANLRNRDGTPVVRISITPLAIDRTPAPLPGNVATDMVYTSQPGGAVADLAMPVVYPNLLGTNPGTRVELYAFNHDTVQWYIYGFGRVSADGRTIAPEIDPTTGRPFGLRDFSWHFPNPPPETPQPPPRCDSNVQCCVGSRTPQTVDLATGSKIETATDISFSGARGGLELTRTHTTGLAVRGYFGRFGRGIKDNFDITLTGNFQAGGAGRFVTIEEQDGRLFSFTRTDPGGALVFTSTATVNQLGDEVRRLTDGTFQYRYADGRALQFDSSRRLIALIDRNGNTTTLGYSGAKLTLITDAVGRSIMLDYDASNRVTRATDPLGHIWQYAYDGFGRLSRVTDPLLNTMQYAYDFGSRLVSLTDPRGVVVKQLTYDNSGRTSEQKFADGGIERYNYAQSGRTVTSATVTDPLGRLESKRFNSAGYVIGEIDALGQSSVIERDVMNNLPLATTGPCGCPEVTRTFDSRGNLISTTNRLGHITRYEYEPVFNNVTRTTDPLGRVTTYTYDARGNLASVVNALNQTTIYTYDVNGQLTGITDPLGHVSRLEYDTHGNVTARIDALGNRITMEYDDIGRLTAATDPLGRRTSMEYDALGRVISMTDPAGATTLFTYDGNGNQVSLTDPLGRQWARVYDTKNRLLSSIDPLGRITRYTYNSNDELIATTSPSVRTTRYTYDPRGQRLTLVDPRGGVVRYGYDYEGNLTTLTDQRGNTTTFTYDELFRQKDRRDPLGKVSSVGYDAIGNVTERIDRLGRRTVIQYDALNRPTGITYADAVVTYSYDAAGRRIRVDDTQGGSIVWSYDEAKRLLSETTPAGTVSYTYNTASQRGSMTAANRPSVTYGYDSAGRLQTITQGAETFTYSYDMLSRLTELSRPNGVKTTHSYDAVNRLTRLSHINAQSQSIEDFGYSYNADDEIASITSLASAQMLSAAKTAGPADAANRIVQFDQSRFSFDLEGQPTTKIDGQGATTYKWDARGRMTQAILPSGQAVNYTYDAIDRRSSRSTGNVTTSFLYDGVDVVVDIVSDGNQVDYINGLGIDKKLRQMSTRTRSLYFLQDHLRSTILLTDTASAVVERTKYEPYGENMSNGLTRYGFTGREYDLETGLLYYRARWYNSHKGRFLSEDPLSFTGGDVNLYRYVMNNPVNFVDPSGQLSLLWSLFAVGFVIASLAYVLYPCLKAIREVSRIKDKILARVDDPDLSDLEAELNRAKENVEIICHLSSKGCDLVADPTKEGLLMKLVFLLIEIGNQLRERRQT